MAMRLRVEARITVRSMTQAVDAEIARLRRLMDDLGGDVAVDVNRDESPITLFLTVKCARAKTGDLSIIEDWMRTIGEHSIEVTRVKYVIGGETRYRYIGPDQEAIQERRVADAAMRCAGIMVAAAGPNALKALYVAEIERTDIAKALQALFTEKAGRLWRDTIPMPMGSRGRIWSKG